jgi:hypothetical protein
LVRVSQERTCLMKFRRHSSGGSTSILAVFFVTLFSVLSISFVAMSNTNLQMARNHRDMLAAQAAAESGLAFIQWHFKDYNQNAAKKTSNNTVNVDDALYNFLNFTTFLQSNLSGICGSGSLMTDPATFSENGLTGSEYVIPAIHYVQNSTAKFTIRIRQYNNDPTQLRVISTGAMGDVTRSVSIGYSIAKDNSLIEFAVASRSPIKITDKTTIGTGIFTDWSAPEIAPPVTASNIVTINGDVNTTLGETEIQAAGYSLTDVVKGTYDQINYDQPDIDIPCAADFDTSAYAKETTVLSSGHTTNTKEYFPHAAGSYTTPVMGSIELNRTVYANMIIADRRAIAGNALFRNCTFSGIFYIGTTSGIGTNNVRFENCTFNGPIITGVPPKFGPEDWKKNCLYFTGTSVFNNTDMAEATILAPNYNVDIGNTGGTTALTGLVLGGVVDVRGNATIDGTIVSMADPLELGALAGTIDTTIGISDSGTHTISITPSPDRLLPIGIATKILMIRDPSSFVDM